MSVHENSKKNLKLFGKDKIASPNEIEKRAATKKLKGQFREKAIFLLENDTLTLSKMDVLYFLDKAGNKLKPSDTIDKIYEVAFQQPAYDAIISKMIDQAANGDHHARKQIIDLVEGYKEKEAEKDESFKEFLDSITVAWNSGPDYVPYDSLGRTPD